MEKCIDEYISVTSGMAGFFAVHVGMFKDEHGEYPDVIQTGIGRYKKRERAVDEAREWARAEEIRCEV